MEIKKHALTYYVGLGDGWSCALAEGRDGYWDVSVGGVDRGRIPEEAMPTLAALFREAFPADGLTVLPSSNYNEAQFETLREELIDLLGLYPEASVDAILDEVRVVDSGLTHAQEAVDALGAENQAVRKALGVSLKDDVVHAAKNAKAAAEAAQDYVIRRAALTAENSRLKDEVTLLRATLEQRTREVEDVRKNARKASKVLADEIGTAGGESIVETAERAAEELRRFIRVNTYLNDKIQRVQAVLNAHDDEEVAPQTGALIRAIWRIVA